MVDRMLPPRSQSEHTDMLERHPVSLRDYKIPTPPLQRAADEVIARVALRQACCPFVGVPRFGKTSAMSYIADELKSSFPKAYVLHLTLPSMTSQSASVFHDFMYELIGGYRDSARNGPRSALLRAARLIMTSAQSAKATQIVFVFDELQRLTVDQLTYLADLINEISLTNFRVTVVATGSLEMKSRAHALQTEGRVDLIGRFFADIQPFEGIETIDELREVMAAYDDPEIAEFPPNSGWSFSRFFLPTAWNSGWRLSDGAPALMDAFKIHARPAKKFQIGAEYWSLAIERVLQEVADFHRPSGPEDKLWQDAVAGSGFAAALNVTYFPTDKSLTSRPADVATDEDGDGKA